MLANAKNKNARDHAGIIKDELDRRFPGWDAPKSKKGGAKAAVARFGEFSTLCATTKDAYIWLVERFSSQYPDLLSDPRLASGRDRKYFARTPEELFHETPELADDRNNYARLSGGWYANVNLNNAQKFDILARLARASHLEWPSQWDLEVLDPTDALKTRKLLEDIIKNINL